MVADHGHARSEAHAFATRPHSVFIITRRSKSLQIDAVVAHPNAILRDPRIVDQMAFHELAVHHDAMRQAVARMQHPALRTFLDQIAMRL